MTSHELVGRMAIGVALILQSGFARAQAEPRESLYSQLDPPKPTPPREPPRSRFGLGMMLGAGVSRSLEIDGEHSDSEHGNQLNGGLAVTFDQHITRGFSLGVAGRIASWDTTRTTEMGYGRALFEADLVPRLRHTVRGIAEGYVAFPFGLTGPDPGERPQRGVRESWDPHTGFNLGPALGIELWGKHWGGFAELGYFVRIFSADVTSTPVTEPTAAVVERFDYVDRQLMLTLGGLYGR